MSFGQRQDTDQKTRGRRPVLHNYFVHMFGAMDAKTAGQFHHGNATNRVGSMVFLLVPYWYLISRVFNFAFFAIVKKSRN